MTGAFPMLQLSGFSAHQLRDVGALALMSRVDTKYLVCATSAQDLLNVLQREYSILEIGGTRLMRYRTDYFDTADFALYYQHHNGHAHRSKVRCRHYLDSDKRFLELKTRNNKGRTVKNRVGVDTEQDAQARVPDLLRQFCGQTLHSEHMGATLRIDYRRVTLQSRIHGERVSIDVDLCAGRKDEAPAFYLPALAIVEIKQNQFNPGSPVQQVLRRLGTRPGAFSKYCIASALLYAEHLKTNRFKRTLSRINPYLESTRGN
jgi:hypothetical protein